MLVRFERNFTDHTAVPQAIASLLRVAIPKRFHQAIAYLLDQIIEQAEVAPHAGRRWGELTADERKIVADAVGKAAQGFEKGDQPDCQGTIFPA